MNQSEILGNLNLNLKLFSLAIIYLKCMFLTIVFILKKINKEVVRIQ